MTDVYQKYMHRIAIAITTRLQDQGKGLIMLPMNPLPILFPSKPVFFSSENGSIPRHSQLLPNRGRRHQTD